VFILGAERFQNISPHQSTAGDIINAQTSNYEPQNTKAGAKNLE
jgi:hypothetical protein